MAEPTSFDGFSVNGSSDYRMTLFAGGATAPRVMAPALRARTNHSPVLDAVQWAEARIPFVLYLADDAAITPATFRANVKRYFTPYEEQGRTLLATHEDGSTALTATAWITSLEQRNAWTFDGELIIPEGCFRAVTGGSDSSSPLTVAGEFKALPSLAITSSGSTLARRRVTITDNCGRGLANYPVMIEFDSTGYSATTAADYIVFYAGRSVPFYAHTLNNAATRLWLRVDCPPSGSVTLDIYYGSGINNTVTANELEKGGMDLDDAGCDNDLWHWDAPFTISTNPRGACGVWSATRSGQVVSGTSFGILDEAGAEFNIQLAPNGTLAGDADGAALVVGTGAASSNALSNLSRDDVSVTGTSHRIRVRYRTANQLGLTVASTHAGGGAETGVVSVPGAVEIVLTAEALDAAASATAEFKLAGGSNLTLALDATLVPTVSVGSATAAELIDGTITNTTTGDTITLDDVYLDEAATLTINCLTQTISISSGPMHTAGNGIQPSNAEEWFPLAIGSNEWTVPSGVALTLTWQNRYFV